MTPLWTPSPDRVAATLMDRFRRAVAEEHPEVTDTLALHEWSVRNPGAFWQHVWADGRVIGDPGPVAFQPGADGDVRGGRFFPEARLSYAENILAAHDGANEEAIIALSEGGDRVVTTWARLRSDVAAMAAALLADGVQPGDRVAAFMPHVTETVIAFLAANAIGATFTSTSSDFGTAGVVDRFGQTTPTVLVAADGYRYGGKSFDCLPKVAEVAGLLPSLRRTIVVGVLDDTPDVSAVPNGVAWRDHLAAHEGAPLEFRRMPGDHPVYILYSSGTTGKPKCITHRALGVLLMHLKEHRLHCDIRPGDRVLYFTTCGWVMWNWLASVPASGATIVLFDGSPFHPEASVLLDRKSVV
jgi:acetoacetyl-CoA synthetase